MIRMTPEEFEARSNRIKDAMAARMDAAKSHVPGTPKAAGKSRRTTRNKYGAVPVVIDGLRFDSKAEGKRYQQLKLLERVGEISNLETQVAFDLIPAQEFYGRKERPVRYFADFRYVRVSDGESVVEDVKSAPTKTKEFILKRKLVLWLHKVVVQEVFMT